MKAEAIADHFMDCPRCGPFVTEMEVIAGDARLEEAAQKGQGQWLALEWTSALPELLDIYYEWTFDLASPVANTHCADCHREVVYYYNFRQGLLPLLLLAWKEPEQEP